MSGILIRVNGTAKSAILAALSALCACLGMLGCDSGGKGINVAVNFDASASLARDTSARVDVYLVSSCAAITVGQRPASSISSVSVLKQGEAGSFDRVDPGPYGLYAFAQDSDCAVVAAKCVPITIDAQTTNPIPITLSTFAGTPCSAGLMCQIDTGECVVSSDGGTGGTGGTDGGTGDSCSSDPCGIVGGNGKSCTANGPTDYTCTCNGKFNPVDDCASCTPPFDGINCQCDTSMGQTADGMGGCRSCAPTPNVTVTLPTSNPDTPTYTDIANGFTITAADCDDRVMCEVTFSANGVGANAYRSYYAIEEFDALVIEFFDATGVSSTASNVSISLSAAGGTGDVVVTIDDGAPGAPVATTPGGSIDIDETGVHKIKVEVPLGEDVISFHWAQLAFDHDCL